MAKLWLLATTSSEGKIIEVIKRGGSFRLVKKLQHSEASQKNRDLQSDRPGRAFASQGTSRSAMSPQETPHEHAMKVFAKEIGETLDHGLKTNEFEQLIIVAPPHFLGALRSNFSDELKNSLLGEIDKDLYSLGLEDKELWQRVSDLLDLPTPKS